MSTVDDDALNEDINHVHVLDLNGYHASSSMLRYKKNKFAYSMGFVAVLNDRVGACRLRKESLSNV